MATTDIYIYIYIYIYIHIYYSISLLVFPDHPRRLTSLGLVLSVQRQPGDFRCTGRVLGSGESLLTRLTRLTSWTISLHLCSLTLPLTGLTFRTLNFHATPLLFRPLLFVDSLQSPYSKKQHNFIRQVSLNSDTSLYDLRLSLYPPPSRLSRHAQADTLLDWPPRRFSLSVR